MPQFDRASDKSQFVENFVSLASMCRISIYDRLEEYEWPLTMGISVPSISRGNVTILAALAKTDSVIRAAGLVLGIQEEIDDIMNKTGFFHVVDKRMPHEIKAKLGL